MKELKHQYQPTPYTCVHACLAMLLDKPVEEVVEEVGYPNGMRQQELLACLDHYDLMHAPTLFGKLWFGWQLVCVPSLNNRGGLHQILVHYEKGKYTVLDPSPKIQYKEDGSDLAGWCDVVLVNV